MSTSIPLDPQNPAQVWAAVGIGEILATITGGDPSLEFGPGRCTFSEPVSLALDWLAEATVSLASPEPMPSAERWGTAIAVREDARPQREATCEAHIDSGGARVVVSCWCDPIDESERGVRIKFWSGGAGIPGAVILDRLLGMVRDDLQQPELVSAPLDWGVGTDKADLRMDYRGSPGDVGFKLRGVVKYPLTEILAAIGLRHMRPERFDLDDPDRRGYRYFVPAGKMPLGLHRAAHNGDFGGQEYLVHAYRVVPAGYSWRVGAVDLGETRDWG